MWTKLVELTHSDSQGNGERLTCWHFEWHSRMECKISSLGIFSYQSVRFLAKNFKKGTSKELQEELEARVICDEMLIWRRRMLSLVWLNSMAGWYGWNPVTGCYQPTILTVSTESARSLADRRLNDWGDDRMHISTVKQDARKFFFPVLCVKKLRRKLDEWMTKRIDLGADKRTPCIVWKGGIHLVNAFW